MTIKQEIKLRDFNFWSGAKLWVDKLTCGELDTIEEMLETSPFSSEDGCMTATELNDFIWFEPEVWTVWIGETEESICARESCV